MIKSYKAKLVIASGISSVLIVWLAIINLFAFPENKDDFTVSDEKPKIFPDYSGIIIPPNIAPLNFIVEGNFSKCFVRISGKNGERIIIKTHKGIIRIPAGKWKKMLASSAGSKISFEIYTKNEGDWTKYRAIVNEVAVDSIDNHLVYRIIDPGYELWNRMGIYQRCLENFTEEPLMINSVSDDNCMNCHSFLNNSNESMIFHLRASHGGTVIYTNGTLKKVNTKTPLTISAGVYPAWHPSGKYIAFSVNSIVQSFHSESSRKVEVTDTLSDIILYDIEKNIVFTDPLISSKENFETFPSWSPDGKHLYFCSAGSKPFNLYDKVRYDLLRISFDESKLRFGEIDTVFAGSGTGKSVSFPRVSPDGRYIMFCESDFGNFTIWHKESDLVIKDLRTGRIATNDFNSPESESFHSWSSNGRWAVFSSRRDDGLFTRLYIGYFDTEGKARKPFLLPVKDPELYRVLLKSYNVPEFVKGYVDLNPRKLLKVVSSDPVNAVYRDVEVLQNADIR